MLKILHGSDFHFGSPHLPQVTLGFKRLVNDINPNVIVLSGDFTQRAKVEEYRQARSFLDSLPNIPTIVTPGNHDIPLYRLSQRLFNPFRNYQEFISQDLDSTFLLESFNDMGVELILSGHVHRAFVSYLEANIDEQKISEAMLIVHSGTTASNRGRVYEKRRNTLNVLELGNSDFKVNTYWYEAGEGAFLARGTNVFRRRTFK
jgi:3',5'-cyclic AMP phosphodiesterase CpdA